MIVLRFKLYLKLQQQHGVTERGVDNGLLDSLDVIREKYVLAGRLWILIVSIRIGLEPSFPISISQMMLNLVKVLMKITPFEITTVSFLCLARQEKKDHD